MSLALEHFEEACLSQCICNVVVTGFEIESFQPILFKSSNAKRDQREDYYCKDVARATSAAPTYFRPAHITNVLDDPIYVIDGGLVMNNPSMSALVEAGKLFPGFSRNRLVISLGTGHARNSLQYSEMKNKGLFGWVAKLFTIMMGGAATAVHEQLETLLEQDNINIKHFRPNYYRFEPILDMETKSMDHISKTNIKRLVRVGNELIDINKSSLELIAAELLEQDSEDCLDQFACEHGVSCSDSDSQFKELTNSSSGQYSRSSSFTEMTEE